MEILHTTKTKVLGTQEQNSPRRESLNKQQRISSSQNKARRQPWAGERLSGNTAPSCTFLLREHPVRCDKARPMAWTVMALRADTSSSGHDA